MSPSLKAELNLKFARSYNLASLGHNLNNEFPVVLKGSVSLQCLLLNIMNASFCSIK